MKENIVFIRARGKDDLHPNVIPDLNAYYTDRKSNPHIYYVGDDLSKVQNIILTDHLEPPNEVALIHFTPEQVSQIERITDEVAFVAIDADPQNVKQYQIWSQLVTHDMANMHSIYHQLNELLPQINQELDDPEDRKAMYDFLQVLHQYYRNPNSSRNVLALQQTSLNALQNKHELVMALGLLSVELFAQDDHLSPQTQTLLTALEVHRQSYQNISHIAKKIERLIVQLKEMGDTHTSLQADREEAALDAFDMLAFLNDPLSPAKQHALNSRIEKAKGHPNKLGRNIGITLLSLGAAVSAVALAAFFAPATLTTSLNFLLAANVIIALKFAMAGGATLSAVGGGLFVKYRQKDVCKQMLSIEQDVLHSAQHLLDV